MPTDTPSPGDLGSPGSLFLRWRLHACRGPRPARAGRAVPCDVRDLGGVRTRDLLRERETSCHCSTRPCPITSDFRAAPLCCVLSEVPAPHRPRVVGPTVARRSSGYTPLLRYRRRPVAAVTCVEHPVLTHGRMRLTVVPTGFADRGCRTSPPSRWLHPRAQRPRKLTEWS
jgi:hypothetical protein